MEHPRLGGLSGWRPLASGASATTWVARQVSLDRLVVVKVYRRQLDDVGRRQFLRDAAAASRLSYHPSIVPTHDAGLLPDDRPYLVMDLCTGGSLAQWLEPAHRATEEQVRRVGVSIADALAAAHAGGVVHGNVKPSNILVDGFGHPRLADFRLGPPSALVADRADGAWTLSWCQPPETSLGRPASAAGDVYSLAATLSTLVADQPPRTADSRLLVPALAAALDRDTGARPTAAAFRDQLAALDLTQSPAPPAALGRPVRRRRSTVAILAASAAAAGVAAAALIGVPGSLPAAEQSPATLEPSTRAVTTPATSLPAPPPGPAAGKARPAADGPTSTGSGNGSGVIELTPATAPVKPFRAVEISGRNPSGPRTYLRIERWEGGRWLAFPLPTWADPSGHFTTHVELGPPGRYRLRVVDPLTDARSEPIEVLVAE